MRGAAGSWMDGVVLGLEWVGLGAGLGSCLALLLRPPRSRVAVMLAVLLAVGAGLAARARFEATGARVASLAALEAEIPDRLARSPDPELPAYVTSAACASCHPAEYASWHASHHRTMTETAHPGAVLGAWEGTHEDRFGRRYVLERRGDEYWVEMPDPDRERDLVEAGRRPDREPLPPRSWNRVVMTTGSHHFQTYWVGSRRDGRLFNVPLIWLVQEGRWIPRDQAYLRRPDGPPTQDVWHGACIECHAVAGEKTRGPERTWRPEVAELGIACEACHGPGGEHVRAHRNPVRRYAARLVGDEGEDSGGGGSPGAGDPTIVNPARLSAVRSAEACGYCHGMNAFKGPARRAGHRFRPGEPLEETRLLMRVTNRATEQAERARRSGAAPDTFRDFLQLKALIERSLERDPSFLRDRYWPDGMVRVGGRELNGLIESACFEGGQLDCLDCHSMHATDPDDQLNRLAAGRGDAACLACHPRYAEDVPAHTRHAAGSSGSRCMNCHMPHTVYGLLKAQRSHWIDSPSVATRLATGRATACELCHLDRPLGWVADRLAEDYGHPRPVLDADHERVASGVLELLTGNGHQRFQAAWHLDWPEARAALAGGPDAPWRARFLAHLLGDPYAPVRHRAAAALRGLPGGEALEFDYAAPPGEREAAREALLSGWRSTRGALPAAIPTAPNLRLGAALALRTRSLGLAADRAAALLLTTTGELDAPRFTRLTALRNDDIMDLRE